MPLTDAAGRPRWPRQYAGDVDEQQPEPRRDWFKVVAIIALSLGVLAMVGGTVLMAAAFLFVGA